MPRRGSQSPEDRALGQEITLAIRHVTRAEDVCLRVSRNRDPELRVQARRAQDLRQVLGQVRSMLDRVGALSPGYDTGDPDLLPEEVRMAQFIEQQKERRKQRDADKRAERSRRNSLQHRVREALGKMLDEDEDDGTEQ